MAVLFLPPVCKTINGSLIIFSLILSKSDSSSFFERLKKYQKTGWNRRLAVIFHVLEISEKLHDEGSCTQLLKHGLMKHSTHRHASKKEDSS